MFSANTLSHDYQEGKALLYIENLTEGKRIQEIYLCRSRKGAVSKNGKPYENVLLQDKTGTLDAKIWDVESPGIEDFDTGDYVEVQGDVSNYQGKLQLSIRRARKAVEGEYEDKDYLPTSRYHVDEMYDRIIYYIDSVENEYLKKLLESYFKDEEFQKLFSYHSAAKTVHHGFIGGLLQHTVFVTRICEFLSKQYKVINRDLLITAALFHDIGKLRELSRFPQNDYTDEGQLIGHIVVGVEMIDEKIREIEGFPETLGLELKHCILAHHGQYEFGSPKKPALVEAFALAMADNLDAKIEVFTESFEHLKDDNYEWQGFNRLLDSNIRRTHKDYEKK